MNTIAVKHMGHLRKKSLIRIVRNFVLVLNCVSLLRPVVAGASDTPPPIPEIEKAVNEDWRFVLPVFAEVGGGYLSGEGTINVQGPLFSLSLSIDPELRYKKRKAVIGLSLQFDERETFGFQLAERHVQGGADFEVRLDKKWSVGGGGEVGFAARPNWPDPYQPEIDGDGERTGVLLPTDRNAYLHAEAEAFVERKLKKRIKGQVYSEYYYQNNIEDPNYDQTYDPTHLVPGDRDRVRGGFRLTSYTKSRFFRSVVDFRTDWIRYRNAYSRDAKTGYTHAAPGGDPANPLQRFVRLRLRQRNSFKLIEDTLKLVLAGDYTRNMDPYERYYTWNQLGADLTLRSDIHHRFSVEAGYGFQWRRYTKDGYQETDTHPALDNGDHVRMNWEHAVRGRVEAALYFQSLRFFIESAARFEKTNFPDYAPGIFPAGSQYLINWDYTNFEALAGILVEI